MPLIQALQHFVDSSRRHELARDHVTKAILRFAKVQLVSRTLNKPLTVPFVDKTTIRVAAGYTGANGNHYWGLFEPPDMAFVLHYLRPDDLFIDAGANVGSYTLLASGAVGCRSIAFEPAPTTIERLMANLADNALLDRVDVRQTCLGDTQGVARFTIDADTMNQVTTDPGRSTIEAPVRRLDEEVHEAPAIIKIDTEGFDDHVLRGADRLISGNNPMAILIETLGDAGTGPSWDDTCAWLLERGFKHMGYEPFNRRLVAPQATRTYNNLFIRGHEAAQDRVTSAPPYSIPGFRII